MQIEVSTDSSIDGSETLTTVIKDLVHHELTHLEDHISRVEVHLTDIKPGHTGQGQKHCMLEARLKGRQPTVVKDAADSLEQATQRAAGKMKSALESILGKQADRH